jgi:ketosteroid isomerase-like protein
VLLPVLCILGVGCRGAADLGELSSEDRDAIRDLREAFVRAELRGDRTAQAGLFTVDAVLMEPEGGIREGRSAILKGLREFDVTLDEFALASNELGGGHGFAYDRGTYATTWRDFETGSARRESGNYLMIVRKVSRGRWRIAALFHNHGAESLSSTP